MKAVFLSPVKQLRDMYCFSGVGGGIDGINFGQVFVLVVSSRTMRTRAIEIGS